MSLRHHEIAEAGSRILNPFVEGQLRLLGEVARVGPGTRILDLASGKGEMLCRWAEWFGTGGVGVDLSDVFVADARARAEELGVAGRVSFVQGDAAAYEAERGAFDIACCIGATWIGDGLVGTIHLLRRAVRPGGLIIIGEPFWLEEPPPEALADPRLVDGDYLSLGGTLHRFESAGVDLVEMVLANQDSWDRYEAAHWWTIAEWLAANPDDPDHDAMRRFLEEDRRTYLTWGRRYLGWGVFVTRVR